MEENWRERLKGRNGGAPSDPVANSLWKEIRDAGERRSGMKVQGHKTVKFPFPGDSCAPFPWGIPHFSLPWIPCFCQAPSQPNPSSTARWDFPVFPPHSRGEAGSFKGSHTNPSFLREKIPSSSSQRPSRLGRGVYGLLLRAERSGNGIGTRHPPTSCLVGKGFSIPSAFPVPTGG